MDVEKTMQFILDQQAQFWANLQEMRAVVKEMHTVNEAAHAALEAEQRRQRGMLDDVILVVGQLAAHQTNLAAAQQRTEEKLQDVTDNLNALIKVVDDLIRRDGGRV